MTPQTTDVRRAAGGIMVVACLMAATLTGAAACGGSPPVQPAAPPASGTPSPSAPQGAPSAPVSEPYAPPVDAAAFTTTVDNPYFPLRPGMRWEYQSRTKDGVETTVVVVTARVRTVLGIPCVEVRDTVRLDGEVIEDTLDWYAQHRDGSVWYLGEDTKEYEDGNVVSTEGTWQAGVDGAQPGIIMPAEPLPGDRYRQEYYRGHAEDLGEVIAVGQRARVPAGAYKDVVVTKDTTPLEPNLLEHKYYAAGVGPVLTIDVAGGGTRDELVRFSDR